MAPLGSPPAPHKGFGLALLVDVLAGVLSGSGFARGWRTERREASFGRSTSRPSCHGTSSWRAAQIDQIKQGERRPGIDELLVPGDRGQRRYLDHIARGVVPLAPASWQVLVTSCRSLSAPLPTVLDD
jgi:LDH2 family malate/lactate/ureidoglycolate dehydrogenase